MFNPITLPYPYHVHPVLTTPAAPYSSVVIVLTMDSYNYFFNLTNLLGSKVEKQG